MPKVPRRGAVESVWVVWWSIPVITLACGVIAVARWQGRKGRRVGSRLRRAWGWMLLGVGVLLMILGRVAVVNQNSHQNELRNTVESPTYP